jgi:hypothetical protein
MVSHFTLGDSYNAITQRITLRHYLIADTHPNPWDKSCNTCCRTPTAAQQIQLLSHKQFWLNELLTRIRSLSSRDNNSAIPSALLQIKYHAPFTHSGCNHNYSVIERHTQCVAITIRLAASDRLRVLLHQQLEASRYTTFFSITRRHLYC